MLTIDEYMDIAKSQQGFASDRELARHITPRANVVGPWRSKRAWPSDEHMVMLAELAGKDPVDALIHLNIWRAKGKARDLYKQMVSRLAVILIVFLSFSAEASIRDVNKPCTMHNDTSQSIYYATLRDSAANAPAWFVAYSFRTGISYNELFVQQACLSMTERRQAPYHLFA